MTLKNSKIKSAEDLLKEAEAKLEKESEKKQEDLTDLDIDERLAEAFDEQLDFACNIIDNLSLNALQRLFKRHLAYPIKHDEARFKVTKKDEKFPNEILSGVMAIKTDLIKSKVLDDIKKWHESEAKRVKESHDAAEEFEQKLGEQDAGTNPS